MYVYKRERRRKRKETEYHILLLSDLFGILAPGQLRSHTGSLVRIIYSKMSPATKDVLFPLPTQILEIHTLNKNSQ